MKMKEEPSPKDRELVSVVVTVKNEASLPT
jgi:hypothetical protein